MLRIPWICPWTVPTKLFVFLNRMSALVSDVQKEAPTDGLVIVCFSDAAWVAGRDCGSRLLLAALVCWMAKSVSTLLSTGTCFACPEWSVCAHSTVHLALYDVAQRDGATSFTDNRTFFEFLNVRDRLMASFATWCRVSSELQVADAQTWPSARSTCRLVSKWCVEACPRPRMCAACIMLSQIK